MQGEPVGLGDAFQSGIRSIQWPDGANHEGLAPLLRVNYRKLFGETPSETLRALKGMSRVDLTLK